MMPSPSRTVPNTPVPNTPATTPGLPPPPRVPNKILIMGKWEETFIGSGEYNARMGGVSLADWSGLDPNQCYHTVTTLHYRPLNPTLGAKGYNIRTKGLGTQFKKNDDISELQFKVWDHLTAHGMDTIAYLQDPFDPSKVINVVENHPRFSGEISKAIQLASLFTSKFDTFDKENDASAKTFLIDSLDPSLC